MSWIEVDAVLAAAGILVLAAAGLRVAAAAGRLVAEVRRASQRIRAAADDAEEALASAPERAAG